MQPLEEQCYHRYCKSKHTKFVHIHCNFFFSKLRKLRKITSDVDIGHSAPTVLSGNSEKLTTGVQSCIEQVTESTL